MPIAGKYNTKKEIQIKDQKNNNNRHHFQMSVYSVMQLQYKGPTLSMTSAEKC